MRPLLLTGFISLLLLSLSEAAETSIDFNRDIRPILSENCLACHGFDEEGRQADLRLDRYDAAIDSGTLIPGDPDESEVMRRILSDDPDEVMPPPETEKQLSKEEITLLQQWIVDGAAYEQHWAWRPLVRPETGGAVGAEAIDALLEQSWKDNSAAAVPLATPREQLRRLSFDLRGIPPTYQEVQQFETQPSHEALMAFRDRWMEELDYAEHQAVRWLDLVRWADTSGLVSDEPIASGAYRAWIIESIFKNQPFDEFSIEQLAGDLLPSPTDSQLIASGYNRIVNTNCEAGAIEEEQLYKLKGEHVRAIGTVWLGITTGCAECHDHKFDPFSANDYYRLAAFFDDLVEAGVYTPGDRREPLHHVHRDRENKRQDQTLTTQLRELSKQISEYSLIGQEQWESEVRSKLNETSTRTDFVWLSANLPAARVIEGDFEFVHRDQRPARRMKPETGSLARHHVAELMTGYLNPAKVQTDAKRDSWYIDVWIDAENRPDLIGFQISNGRYGRVGWEPANYETYYWGNDSPRQLKSDLPLSTPNRVKRVADLPKESGWIRLNVPFDQQIKPVAGKTFERTGIAWIQVGGDVAWGDSGLELRTDKATQLSLSETGMRRWWDQPMNRQIFERRAEFTAKSILADEASRDAVQSAVVAQAYREASQTELMAKMRAVESQLWVNRKDALAVLVSRRAPARKTTRLLHRGDYQDKTGPIVEAAFPELLSGNVARESEGTLTRLELARWLFAEETPIVARVFVNRLWHQFYGRGLSETLEDAGTQGDWPSNLPLLDWLACEFRESGWDRNHMVRLLTSTRAYRLSSKPTPDLQNRDPGNRWHARQSRFRLNAESIRDSALLAAGLLQRTDSVPINSFYPYQPAPYWNRSDKVMYGSRHLPWDTSRHQNQYLRSLYTFWKRQNIHPTMLAFDAPTRQECTAKRNITNTPGQALALLNDPIFVESARGFATAITSKYPNATDEQMIHLAFKNALQREASSNEILVLKGLLEKQRTHFRAHPEMANQLMSVGQSPAPENVDATEIAAWTIVARTLLNLHEFLNRP